jgi:hypothetical protein
MKTDSRKNITNARILNIAGIIADYKYIIWYTIYKKKW